MREKDVEFKEGGRRWSRGDRREVSRREEGEGGVGGRRGRRKRREKEVE